MESPETGIVRAFNDAINSRDIDKMAALMTEDHTFIDSGGTAVSGAGEMVRGWIEFFHMFSDYTNTFDHILQDGGLVVAVGKAAGTYNGNRGPVPENRIEMPAAWRAVVENGKIKEWQVYADWSEGSRIIADDAAAAPEQRK